jgi:hypothetical protein
MRFSEANPAEQSGPPSMMPAPPAEPTYVMRLRLRLRQVLNENRQLRFDNTALRRALIDIRHKMRRKVTP